MMVGGSHVQGIAGSRPGNWTIEQAIAGIAQEAAKGIANPEWTGLRASALLVYIELTDWYRVNPVRVTPDAKLAGGAGLLGQRQYLELIESEGYAVECAGWDLNVSELVRRMYVASTKHGPLQ